MMNKLFGFFFIAYLLSSCVEDIRELCPWQCGQHDTRRQGTDGTPHGDTPGDKQPVVRSIENGTAGEEQGLSGFTWMLWTAAGLPVEYRPRSTADGALRTFTPTDGDSVYAVSTLFDIGTLEAGYTLRVRAQCG